VNGLESTTNPGLLSADNASGPSGPYILTCSYCQWSSTEIGIKFDKPNGIYSQLMKTRNGGKTRLTSKERRDRRKENATAAPLSSVPEAPADGEDAVQEEPLDGDTQFANLKQFYQTQMSETSGSGTASLGDLGFSSPGSLSRIMSLYTTGLFGDKSRAKARIGIMREALNPDEGLQICNLDDEVSAVAQLREAGWDGTASPVQTLRQFASAVEPPLYGRSRFVDSLRPIPYLLRTKRSKRCSVCRHIMSKPEAKINSNRFRIRLVAGSYIPSISIRLLSAGPAPTGITAAEPVLTPLKPVQYLLTFKNPIFETIKVTLATPATTPGRFSSKVTVLCPQFEIDANTDVWDEALKDGEKDRRRRKGEEASHQAEAGKIWERGRNWVSVVVEVVPASLRLDTLAFMKKEGRDVDTSPLKEDEDVLEIPMFVRLEWEADATNEDVGAAPGKEKDAREKRELAYWACLGLGRIAEDQE
jgi:dynactin 4